jgi:hypothetical protein
MEKKSTLSHNANANNSSTPLFVSNGSKRMKRM